MDSSLRVLLLIFLRVLPISVNLFWLSAVVCVCLLRRLLLVR